MTGIGAGALDGEPNAAGYGDVVVLDQDGVVEAEAVVGAAAAFDGVFVEGAVAGDGLAGAADLCMGVGDQVLKGRRIGGDPRHAHEVVEGDALCGQNGTGITVDAGNPFAGLDAVAILLQRLEPERRIDGAEGSLGKFKARQDAVLAGCQHRLCGGRRRYGGIGRNVPCPAQVFQQCSPHGFVDQDGRQMRRKRFGFLLSRSQAFPFQALAVAGSRPVTPAATSSASSSVMKVRCFHACLSSGKSERK